MITYELAKELKDAGFLQPICSGYQSYCKDCRLENGVFLPALEELIEACGQNFVGVNFVGVPGYKRWKAVHCNLGTHTEYGESPTEAVARLWLALNKKTI